MTTKKIPTTCNKCGGPVRAEWDNVFDIMVGECLNCGKQFYDEEVDLTPEKRDRKVKTHCPQGHPYTPENTYYYINPESGKSFRTCRICRRARERKPDAARNQGVVHGQPPTR